MTQRSPSRYSQFSQWIARNSGQPAAFLLMAALTLAWLVTGPFFNFSDTWQLVMNTASSIITFLMVFVIQNTQNRQNDALQIKLDELIRTTEGAHNALLDLEELDAGELIEFRRRYLELALKARKQLQRGKDDTDICDL